MPGGIILGYHRISDTTWDPLNLAISREKFRDQLEVLSEQYNVVSLTSLLTMKRQGRRLKGCVSITFDDGCDDFIRYAVPELTSRDMPATVFVTTGNAGERFWWDEVGYLVNCLSRDADQIEIDLGVVGGKRVFKGLSSEESSANAVREICDQMLALEPVARSEVVDQIRQQISGDITPGSGAHAMTREQLQELSAIPIIEVAAHTVTHPRLSYLGDAEQLEEIQNSKLDLEALGITVTGFSYPNGDYSSQTCRFVKDCGFEYACRSWPAAVRRSSDRYQLPRVWVPNVGGQEFRRWMSVWSGLRN
jgi:peptidoglycan/xylan/chitin deacetylase (PgdA/CDA1 family)